MRLWNERFAERIRPRRGEGYIELCVGVLVFVLILVLAMNLFSLLTLRVELGSIAETLLEAATESGAFGSEYESMKNALEDENGIFTAEFRADTYFNTARRLVQLGERMEVTVSAEATFGVGSFGFPVTVTVTRHGLSERYWK